jgi:suppressor for copper-sensitivity B
MKVVFKLTVVLSFLWTAVALAADSTPWAGRSPAQSRLILESSQSSGGSVQRAGVQIKLDRGWWTYWRAPGSSGLPPVFDWSGSENLADEPEIAWPMPSRIVAFGEELNLYKDEVVFPVEFRAANPKKPVKLRLKVMFGACRNMCVPAQAAHEITLPPATGSAKINRTNANLIAAYSGRKPSYDPRETGLEIKSVTTIADGRKAYLAIRMKGLATKSSSLVLVEGPDLTRVAEIKPRPTGDGVTKLLMIKLGPAADLVDLPGKRIRLTVIDGGRALEQTWVVGAEGSALVGFELLPGPRRPMDKPEPWASHPAPGSE